MILIYSASPEPLPSQAPLASSSPAPLPVEYDIIFNLENSSKKSFLKITQIFFWTISHPLLALSLRTLLLALFCWCYFLYFIECECSPHSRRKYRTRSLRNFFFSLFFFLEITFFQYFLACTWSRPRSLTLLLLPLVVRLRRQERRLRPLPCRARVWSNDWDDSNLWWWWCW